ncbi:MAG: ISAs1 family transposase [ANME-2 cluster archaeon]|nr:MAG: ISAs1 family transposase [ANME-2 cluster archaeon]
MLLCEAQIHNTRKVKMECNTGKIINLGNLYALFQRLMDKRKPKGKRYALETIMLGIFLAKLCGEDKPSGIADWVALRGEWIVSMLNLKRKSMPSHHTYRRILADAVNVEEFERLAREYFQNHGEAGYQVIVSIDGKVVRGTIDAEVSDGLCLLAAYLPDEGVILAQVAIKSKTNEITAAPTLLEYVDLRNKVVIGDALHTQRQISIQIGKAGGNYIWTVKGNQPQLRQDLQDWFDLEVELLPGMGCPPKDFCSATITNKGHGRLEVRTLTTSSQLNDFLDWPFLQQVFKLERQATICKTGKSRHEIVYGVTSLSAEQASPSQLLRMLRSYWKIENSLHYPRDVTLHEDQTRFKKHSAAHTMAVINNLILGLIAKSDFDYVPSARRHFAAHPDEALHLLL